MKTYDFKIEGSYFSVWDIKEKHWVNVPTNCTYYNSIPSSFHGTKKDNKKCKVDETRPCLVKAAAKEYIRKRLKGRTRSFFQLPYRREE